VLVNFIIEEKKNRKIIIYGRRIKQNETNKQRGERTKQSQPLSPQG
jgi:hypothetical protein